MSSNPHAIAIKNISKAFPVYAHPHHRLLQMFSRGNKQRWYKEFVALRDVTFNVERGETLGIVGRNGSGKSTLLQIICGTQTPSTGEVNVNGRVAALLELGSGFNPEFSGRENVFLNGMVLGLTLEEIEQRFDSIAAFAEIGDFMERPVRTYSSGMYVRLAFAVAINVMPDILIVDEALSVGDEAFQRKCFARINKIREDGATIIFVSHSASTVVELCNRAVLLDGGELLTMGSPKYVVSRYQKILYSSSDKLAESRVVIKNESELDSSVPETTSYHAEDLSQESLKTDVARDVIDDAYFEKGLVSKSIFRYDPSGVTIEDPHVETLDGRRVNILQVQREYIYTYRVRFDRAASAVRCGMLIKSVTGLDLAGSTTSWSGENLPYVAAGAELVVQFRFPCAFMPGVYFLNAGVLGCIEHDEIYLDRWIDVAMFKVVDSSGRLATTAIDLDIRPRIENQR